MKTIHLLALLLLAPLLGPFTTDAQSLIPFQGRLTDQQGVPYTNGQFTIFFQLYDQSVGGSSIWQERHEKVGVINGMVNVFLGSISPLTSIQFTNTKHLGITVDADNNPNTPDPEMVPRQMIIPAFWARQADNSIKLAGYDWTPIFGANNPSGPLLTTKIADGSIVGAKLTNGTITAAQIADNTISASKFDGAIITSNQIANGSISSLNLASGSILTTNIADGQVTLPKLAARQVGTNVDVGGVAISSEANADYDVGDGLTQVPNLTVTIKTSGRPVLMFLTGTNATQNSSIRIYTTSDSIEERGFFHIKRDGVIIYRGFKNVIMPSMNLSLREPPGSISCLDIPPAGTHTYTFWMQAGAGTTRVAVAACVLVAYEL